MMIMCHYFASSRGEWILLNEGVCLHWLLSIHLTRLRWLT